MKQLLQFAFFLLCFSSGVVFGQEICDNEIDDDNDGLIDCYDSDCAGQNECEDFFFGQPSPSCVFTPPPIDMIELTEVFRTDHVSYPIDQRSGVFIGDMNGDGIPDLVSRDNNPARVQIYSGDDGRILQSIPSGRTHPFGQVAIADVDRNGLGDIFMVEYTERLVRYEFGSNTAVWQAGTGLTDDSNVGTPQLADFNQDGIPEVYVGNRIFDSATGIRYTSDNTNVGGYAGDSNSDRFPIAYDFFQPGDIKPTGGVFGAEAQGLEFAAGDKIYTVDFTNGVANSGNMQLASMLNDTNGQTGDGMTSIADINGDGQMDIAVMDGGRVYAWDPYTQLQIGSLYNIPNTGSGGRINLGDFNGDGDVELGFAGRNIYTVLQLESNNTFSILWQKTGLDDGSQRTGSTLFDFDGDGTVEVVYSEEANLYIYRGTDGQELLRIPSESGTRTEYPLVADVNGDGTAEIVVTAQDGNGPSFSGSGWVTVYGSANQPWVPTRPVWNQHGYNVVNVNDDLSIPIVQQNPLHPDLVADYNNFLVQTPIRTSSGVNTFPAADAVATYVGADFTNCPFSIDLTVEIRNEGATSLPANTPVAVYDGNPLLVAADLLDVFTLGEEVAPGEMITITRAIDISDYAAQFGIIYINVNDPGFESSELPFDINTDFPTTGTAECDYENNVTPTPLQPCGEICDDGDDNDGDGIIDEPNVTAPATEGCPGDVLPQFTSDVGNANGTYTAYSTAGTSVSTDGRVTLGTNPIVYPDVDTIVFAFENCTDTIFVQIVDTEAPQVTCPGMRTQTVDASCVSLSPDLSNNLQVSDNCVSAGQLTIVQSPGAGQPLSLGDNTITVTVSDPAGNSSQCMTTITVLDQMDPVLNCTPSVTVVADSDCQGIVPDLSIATNATDNCSNFANLNITQLPAAGTIINSMATNTSQIVQLTVADETGNSATCTIVVQVEDQTPPSVSCPPATSVVLDPNNCSASLDDYRGQTAADDNCTATADISLTQSPAPGTALTAPGTTMVIITATDLAGNTNNTGCTLIVMTLDQTPPTLSCPAVLMADASPADCSVTLADYTTQVQTNDACDTPTLSQAPTAGTSFNTSTQTITITSTDGSGNITTCNIVIQRQDVSPPTISCPGDQTEDVNTNCEFVLPDYTSLASTGDNCPGSITISQSPAPTTAISTDQQITLIATDASGLTTSCTFMVLLNDATVPAITCPGAQILGVDGSCAVALPDYTGNASLMDNCSDANDIIVSQIPAPGTNFSGDGTMVNVQLTPTDEAGNIGTPCSFTVTLEDMTEPSITCPVSPQINYVDANCETQVPDFRGDVDVSSMCSTSGLTLSQMPAPGSIVSGHNTTTAITITVTDDSGNMASCSFDFLVLDNTPPILNCPPTQTIPVDGSCMANLPNYTTLATTTDNCGSGAISQIPAIGTTLGGAGTSQTVTLSTTDAAGNSQMCMLTVVLEDTTPPVISCPANVPVLVADQSCEAVIPNYLPDVNITDNCTSVFTSTGPGTVTQVPTAGTVLSGDGTTQTVTITARDESGNSMQCTISVSVEDQTAPAISCPPAQILVLDSDCEARIPDFTSSATLADNCASIGELTVSQLPLANTTVSGHNTMPLVTLTADDGNGNTTNCTVQLTLVDDTPPSAVCPPNQDLVLDTNCDVSLPDLRSQLLLNDNCTENVDLSVNQSPAPNTTLSGANTMVTITFMIDDNNGNSTTCTSMVTLRDSTNPAVTCPANDVVMLNASCTANLMDYTGSAMPTDACTMSGDINLTQSPAPSTLLTGHNQTTTVTITANDGNGNTANCTFDVTTNDSNAPSILCPTNADVAVDVNCTFVVPDYRTGATVADNCTLAGDINISQSPLATTLTTLNTTTTITLTATDDAGNSSNCTFDITPLDETPPSLTCPVPQTQVYDASCSVNLSDFTALGMLDDNCSSVGNITVSQTPAAGTNYSNLMPPIVVVTLTATDESGNFQQCDFNVELRDETPPQVTCPAPIVIALDTDCNGELPDLIPQVMANDNCSPNLTILQSPEPGSVYSGDGTEVTVTFTVSDSDGNDAQCTSTVTFEDQSPPNPVICPADQTLTTDDVCAIALPDYRPNTTVEDNCRAADDIILTQSPAPGSMYSGNGTVVPVTITADDGNGNTAICTFDVTLVDNVPVNLACPGGQIVIASSDNCDAILPGYTAETTVTNECMSPAAGVSFTQIPAAGTVFTSSLLDMPQTVTIEATDINNNVASCSFTVTMIDTLAPMLVCPPDDIRSVDASCQHFIRDYLNSVIVSDNCWPENELLLSQSPAVGSVLGGPNNTQEVTITAMDGSNNVSQCVFQVSIEDRTAPNISCPARDTLLLDNTCSATIPDYGSLTTLLDNCTPLSNISLSQTPTAGTRINGHNTNQAVTMTATDGSGNSANCSFVINLRDTLSPIINCPGDQVIFPDANCDALIDDYRTLATLDDNCTLTTSISITQAPTPGTVLMGQGEGRTVTLTADDGNGNMASCMFSVSVEDNVPPTVSCPPDQVMFADADCEYDLEDFRSSVSANDNCTATPDIVLTQLPGIGTTLSGHGDEVEVIITADDGNGNSNQCSFLVSLSDNTPPTIQCPANMTISTDENCSAQIPDYRNAATLNDNCTMPGAITVTQLPAAGTTLMGDGSIQTVTLTAGDGNGNMTNCIFELMLEDDVIPSISCPPAQEIFVDADCEAILPDLTGLTTSSDNCDPVSLSQQPVAGGTYTGVQTQLVTITADDGNGNTNNCQVLVNISDNTAPSLQCPVQSIISANDDCLVTIADYRDSISVQDNCALPADINLQQTAAPGTTFSGLGSEQDIIITATDPSGNQANCIITIVLADTTRPSIVCPMPVDLPVGSDCNVPLPDYTNDATVADNCSSENNLVVTQSPSPGTVISRAGDVIDVTLTITDESGNSEQCTFAVTLVDDIQPQVQCPADDVISVDGSCPVQLPDYIAAAQATDNCSAPDDITLVQAPAAGFMLSGDGTTQVVTITATDESGNINTCMLIVSLEDTTMPMITCPADQELTADDDCEAAIPDYRSAASTSSNCDQGNDITIVQNPSPGMLISGHNTSMTITLTATDGSGNSENCSFDVTLIDRTAPEILDCPSDQTEAVDNACSFTLPDYWATTNANAQDNCRPSGTAATTAIGNQIVYTQNPTPGTVLTGATTTQLITLTADDGNGNVTSCSFVLSLSDETDPIIPVCAVDRTVQVDASCNYILDDYRSEISPMDNCTQASDLIISQMPAPGIVISGDGTTQQVTLTVADASGNTSNCDFTITLDDDTAPTISCPSNQTELVDTNCEYALADFTNQAVVGDNCTMIGVITITQSPAIGTVYVNEGTSITVTLTADDGNDNTANCSFTISLDDQIAPAITCPANQVIAVDSNCEIVLPDLVSQTSVADNCSPAVSGNPIVITQSPLTGTTYSGHATTIDVTLTADDGNGNTSSCQVQINLDDAGPPSITCPANETLFTDSNCEAQLPDYRTRAQLTDNCTANGDILLTQNPIPGRTLSGDGSMETVTLTADDGNGNTINCTLTVSLEDNVQPSIQCPSAQVQLVGASCEATLVDYTSFATVIDNCTAPASISISQLPTVGTVFTGVQQQTITLTADDGNGNTRDCQFQLSIEDNVPPQLTCPPTQVVDADANCEIMIGDYRSLASATDNCVPPNAGSSLTLTQLPAVGTIVNGYQGERSVTIVAQDVNGNTSNCSFAVRLRDVSMPTIVCPPAQDIFVDDDCNTVLPDYRGDATANDNCDDANVHLTYVQSPSAGFMLSGANTTQTVNIMVTDRSGNSIDCDFVVTLRDAISPSIVCPTDDVLFVDQVCPIALPDYTSSATAADNCTISTSIAVTQLPVAGTSYSGDGTEIEVTLTADDGNGNTADCNFTITLEDDTDPTITCPGQQVLLADMNCSALVPDYSSLANASSPCGDISMISVGQLPLPNTVTLTGDSTTQTVTLTADDGNGNNANCTFEVILVDDTAPQITNCPANTIELVNDTCAVILPDYRNQLTATDNCENATIWVVSQNPAPGAVFRGHNTEVEVTYTVDDTNGNTTTCTQTVTLEDDTSPTIICPGDQVVNTDNSCEGVLPDYTGAEVADNCSIQADILVTQSPMAGMVLNGQGTTQAVTLTVDDGNGNTTDCMFTVTLLDDDPPTISCPPSTTIDMGTDCMFSLPDYSAEASIGDNCASNLLSVTQNPMAATLIDDLNTTVEVVLTVTDGNDNNASCSFFVTTTSPSPPPLSLTVTLDAIPDVNGGELGTFDLDDALNPMAIANTTNADLDGDLVMGPGPYIVTYYEELTDAEQAINAITNPNTYQSTNGTALAVRLEDPASGCFTISQILLSVRTQGTSGLVASITFCNKGPFILSIDGMPAPANATSTLTHQWVIVDPGVTRITPDRLLTPTEQVLEIDTEGLQSGFVELEYQFFEDYGIGPIVPSIPTQVRVELTNVGGGTFPWNGED